MTTLCPFCGRAERQVKAGTNNDHQRYKCGLCQRRYIPLSAVQGYTDEVRRQDPKAVADAVATACSPPTAKRRPTIGDVARRAEVSTASVSNYLNQKGRMAEATRLRIQTAMEELRFTPSALVRAIQHRRTNILGVVLFGLGSLDDTEGPLPYLTPALLRGINDGADAADNDLLLYTGWPRRGRSNTGVRFLDGHIDGLIWMNLAEHRPILDHIVAAGLPTVALMTRDAPDGAGYIRADNIGAMGQLVAHLAGRGHRHIAFIGPSGGSDFRDRHEGYRQAMEVRGLPWEPALEVTAGKAEFHPEGAGRVLDTWLTLPSPPTAVLCAMDHLAARLAEAMRARGIHIPEDIALAGFDDMPIAEHIAGGLTTIRQPFRRMGRLAAESLLALVDGAPADAHRLTLPTELVIRASTAGNSNGG
jgi:DNA-binding LacI/PurR family transcriptional regulator